MLKKKELWKMTEFRVQDIGSMRIEKNNDNIAVCILGVCICVLMIEKVNFSCWHENFIQENYNAGNNNLSTVSACN
jgi:hypothetical protein